MLWTVIGGFVALLLVLAAPRYVERLRADRREHRAIGRRLAEIEAEERRRAA